MSFLPGMAGVAGMKAAGDVLGPKSISYIGRYEDDTDLTTYTSSTFVIGDTFFSRRVIVAVGGGNQTRTFSSVSLQVVDGSDAPVGSPVAMSSVVALQSGNMTSGIFIAAVPSGTRCQIVVVWSGAQSACGIGLWTAAGLASNTHHATATSTARPASLTIDTLAGGFVMAYSCHAASGAGSNAEFSWTNATERFDSRMVSERNHSGADAATSGGSLAVSVSQVTDNANRPSVAASW